MDLSIRDTVLDDLAEIFRIRSDELVRPHQYKLRANDSIDAWANLLSGNNSIGNVTFKSSTILVDRRVVGHVIRHHFVIGAMPSVQCGDRKASCRERV